MPSDPKEFILATVEDTCIFIGRLIPHQAPLYLGLYVEDFVFFSQSQTVAQKFMNDISKQIKCTFTNKIDYFLGIKFECSKDKKKNITIQMNQDAYIKILLIQLNLHHSGINTPLTPYRSGYLIDTIPKKEYTSKTRERLIKKMQFLIGILN